MIEGPGGRAGLRYWNENVCPPFPGIYIYFRFSYYFSMIFFLYFYTVWLVENICFTLLERLSFGEFFVAFGCVTMLVCLLFFTPFSSRSPHFISPNDPQPLNFGSSNQLMHIHDIFSTQIFCFDIYTKKNHLSFIFCKK